MAIHLYAEGYTVFTEPPGSDEPRWVASLDTSDDEGQEDVVGYGVTEGLALADLFRQIPDADPVCVGIIHGVGGARG